MYNIKQPQHQQHQMYHPHHHQEVTSNHIVQTTSSSSSSSSPPDFSHHYHHQHYHQEQRQQQQQQTADLRNYLELTENLPLEDDQLNNLNLGLPMSCLPVSDVESSELDQYLPQQQVGQYNDVSASSNNQWLALNR